jgi:ABC-2 type transport system permease protein
MNELTGTAMLIRLILRRDRLVLPGWIVLLAAFPLIVASSFAELYPTPELQQAFASSTAANAALIALIGPIYGSSIGALTAWRLGVAAPLLVGLASLLTVVRHTRAEEEAGRRELLGATVVGRHAPLAAALVVTLGANLLLGVLAATSMTAYGLPVAGSRALGLSLTVAGWVVAAVAAVAAQLAETAGGARGIAGTVLGLSFVVRAVGDAGGAGSANAWLSWLSPIGWLTQVRAFGGERWAFFALPLIATVALIAIAYALEARRDLGAGLLPPRLGPAAAAPGLRSPLALAWRLQRAAMLGWAFGFAAIGVVFGGLVPTVADLLRASPQIMAIMERMGTNIGPSDAFFTFTLAIVAEVTPVYAIGAMLRLRGEELSSRADPLLATPVSRVRWAASHVIVAALGTALVLAAFGLGAGLTYGLAVGQLSGALPRILGATLAYWPAVMLLGAIAVALWGALPRLALLSWVALIAILIIDLLGEFGQIQQFLLDLSPFTHVPDLLLGNGSIAPLLTLSALAAALIAVGLLRFRQRDVA